MLKQKFKKERNHISKFQKQNNSILTKIIKKINRKISKFTEKKSQR